MRPTNIFLTPAKAKPFLCKQQYLIYDLIWRRTLASQMIPATLESQKLTLTSPDRKIAFKHTTSVVLEKGWQVVYPDDEAATHQQKFQHVNNVLQISLFGIDFYRG